MLSAGEMTGLPYYTMPLVDGESLRARLARDAHLPITEVGERPARCHARTSYLRNQPLNLSRVPGEVYDVDPEPIAEIHLRRP